jgi:hypothetical protein
MMLEVRKSKIKRSASGEGLLASTFLDEREGKNDQQSYLKHNQLFAHNSVS